MNGGGAEKVTLLLANELSDRGWKVTLMLSNYEGPYLKNLNKDVQIHVLKKKNISKNIFEIVTFLRVHKPTILYSSMMYVNVVAAVSSKIAGYKGKLILSEHSHPSAVINSQGNFTVKTMFFLAKKIFKYAHSIVCVSKGVKDDLKMIIEKLPKLYVINNPIEIGTFNNVDKSDTIFRIVTVGRLHKDKNIEMLAQIVPEIKEKFPEKKIEFNVLGEGPYKKNLEKIIRDNKIEKDFYLRGFNQNPTEFVNNCDLFVFTSNREGFGNVIVEALSTGIPVISTDCPSGPAEILSNGKFGKLIKMGDKNALIKEISEEIRFSTRFDTKKIEMRKDRAAEFRVENIIEDYIEVFEN